VSTGKPVSLKKLDVEAYLADPALRQSYVTPMFDLIAPRYDDFTRVFSFGMDRHWKETLVQLAQATIRPHGIVADVATGTGDLAFALSRVRPDLQVIGADVSFQMLTRARANADTPANVSIAAGDLSALPFADGSLDAVTAGYALRNTPDWRKSIHELARVIRPGGRLYTLDFYVPTFAPWRIAFLGWLAAAGRVVGWWWHREPMAYGYIAKSIAHFATAAEFSAELDRAGFVVASIQRRLGGGIALHHAVRRDFPGA
jgi:demethylmenaquinone methyltransferase/2-methoxy-6-polyprenyl-1,4-benzoquinol methylase